MRDARGDVRAYGRGVVSAWDEAMQCRQGDAAAPLGAGDQQGGDAHRRKVRGDHGGTRRVHVLELGSKCDVAEDLARSEDRDHGKPSSCRDCSDGDSRQKE